MGQEDRDLDAERVGALFRTVLDQREPAVPSVGPQVKRAGARLRLRRRVLTVTAAAVAVAAVATAGAAVTGRSGPDAPAAGVSPGVPDTPSPSGTPTGPAPAAEDPLAADRRLNGAGHADLLQFLRDHPLPGVTRVDGATSVREFTMRRANDGQVRFMREFEGPVGAPEDRESPCAARTLPDGGTADPSGTGCLTVPLPDGALAWVLHPTYRDQPKSVWIRLVTAQGRKFTLSFDSTPVGGSYTTVPLEAVRDLAATPGFVRAVDEGWQDSAIR
ncbi:hypothetical protein [Kitasatospora sp. NPDC057500]|uniref:hypothetical protein n=1 Tax=Kitasatospora sp. NPDC057500 TaxID=3346151 RepID=UPI003696D11A